MCFAVPKNVQVILMALDSLNRILRERARERERERERERDSVISTPSSPIYEGAHTLRLTSAQHTLKETHTKPPPSKP